MKPLVPIACLAAGVAIGWFARPAISGTAAAAPVPGVSASGGAAADSHQPTGSAIAPSPEGADRHSTGRPAKPANDETKASKQAGKQMQDKMKEQMADLQRKKFEARLAKLAADLHLTPQQQEKIRTAMGDRFSKLTGMMDFENEGTPEEKKQRLAELKAMMKNDGLDDATAGLLSDEQKSAYAAFKGKERQTRIESGALKDLSNVTNVIELTPEQRDNVYQALTDQAATRDDNQKGQNMISMFSEGMGMQFDDELGIQDLMYEQMESHIGEDQANLDMKDIQKTVTEAMKQRVDAKVAALKPYLTDTQVQQYRSHLETKAAGVATMFGGGAADEGDK